MKILATLLIFSLSMTAYQAPPPSTSKGTNTGEKKDQTEQKKASLEGTAIDAATGKPVKDAALLLAKTNGMTAPASTKADENGHFKFSDLDAGTFLLIGDHPRYARQTYGSRNGLMGGTPITIATGQQVSDISFRMQPNAVASGRVLDEEGEPVPKVMVAALKGMYHQGKRQLLPLGTAMTNDLGEYRISNLAAGRYTLTAIQMNLGGAKVKPPAEGPEETYTTTFYPNVTDSANAGTIVVTAGQDAAGLDIRLAKTKSVRVKGTVMGTTPDQKISVKLVPKGSGFLSMLTGKTATIKEPERTFEIVGASPGSYLLRVTDTTGMKQLGVGIPLEIGSRAIDGVILEVTPNADVAGTVVVTGENKVPLKGTRLVLEQVDGMIVMPPSATLGEDGSFTLKDVPPNKYLVRLAGGPPNSYVASVQLGNQEMPDEGLSLGGTNAGKLEIKLSLAAGQVDGVINGKDDNPVSGVTVALIPSSKRYLLFQGTYTDQKGNFSFKNVTPGEYKVLAWEDIEPNAFQDPEYLKPFERKAETVTLAENERKNITMKVIPRE